MLTCGWWVINEGMPTHWFQFSGSLHFFVQDRVSQGSGALLCRPNEPGKLPWILLLLPFLLKYWDGTNTAITQPFPWDLGFQTQVFLRQILHPPSNLPRSRHQSFMSSCLFHLWVGSSINPFLSPPPLQVGFSYGWPNSQEEPAKQGGVICRAFSQSPFLEFKHAQCFLPPLRWAERECSRKCSPYFLVNSHVFLKFPNSESFSFLPAKHKTTVIPKHV